MILWRSVRGKVQSQWLHKSGGALEIRAQREGLVIAAGGTIWALLGRPVEVQAADLECAIGRRAPGQQTPPSPLPAPCHKTIALQQTCLQDLLGSREICLPVPRPKGGWAIDRTYELRPLTSVGPYLFLLEENHGMYYQSAHGSTNRRLRVLDLGREGVDLNHGAAYCGAVQLLSDDQRKAIVRRHLPQMKSYLCDWQQREQAPEEQGPCSAKTLAPEDVFLSGIIPRISSEGRLTALAQLTTGSCWNGRGDQLWCDYTCSFRAPLEELPRLLRPFAEAPAAVQLTLRRSPPGEGAGWSRVTGGFEQRRRLHAAFAASSP